MSDIIVDNISLFINQQQVLKDINLSLHSGKIYGLVGRNGSGKTMLMKCICGFIPVSQGFVKVNGNIVGKDIDFPNNMGIIIETPSFIPYYSGRKNLKMLASLNRLVSDGEIENILKKVGLFEDRDKKVKNYSLGMRQRLGIAQALMENHDILILDEPMNGLDKDGVEEIRKLLIEYKEKGNLILLASHSAEDINILCDEVFYMDKGMLE